jgi:hypothetical protein
LKSLKTSAGDALRSGPRLLTLTAVAGQNVAFAPGSASRLHAGLGRSAADHFCRLNFLVVIINPIETKEHENIRMLGERPERSRSQNRNID